MSRWELAKKRCLNPRSLISDIDECHFFLQWPKFVIISDVLTIKYLVIDDDLDTRYFDIFDAWKWQMIIDFILPGL